MTRVRIILETMHSKDRMPAGEIIDLQDLAKDMVEYAATQYGLQFTYTLGFGQSTTITQDALEVEK